MSIISDTYDNEVTKVRYRTVSVDGLEVFYREAGRKDSPTILLLHGFPSSSHMFRGLIPSLADRFHVVAPDYPGFGYSSMPKVDAFEYTFDHLADVTEAMIEKLGIEKFSMYIFDYGAPVGFRLFERNPERVEAFIVQNGNAYEEGLRDFWDPIRTYWNSNTKENADALRNLLTLESTRWQYLNGTREEDGIAPDNWLVDQSLMDREGNQEIQLALFYDYRTNLQHYANWQALFRKHQPPTLIVWGKNDYIFPAEGAHPYKRDLKDIEFHLLDTGHFAIEEDGRLIADTMCRFLSERLKITKAA
jgi:pimeloyl-ACP methyl ester carboxylesterase